MTAAPEGQGDGESVDEDSRRWVVEQFAKLEEKARRSEGAYAVFRHRYEWLQTYLAFRRPYLRLQQVFRCSPGGRPTGSRVCWPEWQRPSLAHRRSSGPITR